MSTTIYLEVNSVPLDEPRWQILSYDELMATPQVRGSDLPMPDADGDRPYPRSLAPTVVSLPLLVHADVDEDGEPLGVPFLEGMMTHRDFLRANLGIGPDGDPDRGTVPAIFHRGELDPWAGPVTVLGIFDWTETGVDTWLARLDLSIPAGELEVTGS